SVSGSNRIPSQAGQTCTTSGRKLISWVTAPWPLHVEHRPPAGVLNEKRAAGNPATCPWGDLAKSCRMGSQIPRKVAGTERGVRPIGDWSTLNALFTFPSDDNSPYGPGDSVTRPSA